MLSTAEDGAGAYCHPGVMRLALVRVHDRLDDTLTHGAVVAEG
ncbi:hypothetical protein [Kitasatospora sp. NPDC057015]